MLQRVYQILNDLSSFEHPAVMLLICAVTFAVIVAVFRWHQQRQEHRLPETYTPPPVSRHIPCWFDPAHKGISEESKRAHLQMVTKQGGRHV